MKKKYLFRAVALLACVASLGVAGATTSTAQGVKNPFEVEGKYCEKHTAPAGAKNSSNPGVSPTQLTFSDVSLDVEALRRLAGVDQMNFNQAYKAYVNIINKECGGINGRKIVMKTSLYNVLAPDLQGHLQALCIKVTEDFKSLVNFGTGMPQIQRCVSVNHKTISIAAAETPSKDFIDAKGRVVGRYPASDQLALAFIKDGAAQGTFKGRKVGVLSANIRANSTALARNEYVDELEKVGVSPQLEMLPCTGNVCTSNVTSAIRKLKDAGVNLLILTTDLPVSAIGTVFREMKAQNFKATTWSPGIDALHSDSNQNGIVRASGSDGAQFIEDTGYYATDFILRNGWRLGKVKETPYGKMCTAALAKETGGRQYQFNEADINNARWTGTVGICFQVRRIAAAIWSLGNNVTSDRLAAVLRTQKLSDLPDTQPMTRTTQWYSDANLRPTGVFTLKFNYPCPLPTRGPATGACMLSVDRPPRQRAVKY